MIDISIYPPAPVLWASKTVDVVCGDPFHLCENWRDYAIPSSWSQQGAWFSNEFRVGDVRTILPDFVSYHQFVAQKIQSSASSTSPSVPSTSLLYEWLFQTRSTTLADLTTPSSIIALIILVVLLRRIKAVLLPWFSSLGRKAARHTHGLQWEQHNQVRIIKFGEYVFRLVFHTAISIAGIYYFWDKEWWKPGGTYSLWLDFPHQDVEPGMIWYYLIQSAYNLEALLSLLELSLTVSVNFGRTSTNDVVSSGSSVQKQRLLPFPTLSVGWSPTVRGDFREMFIHHVITNLLVIGSSFFRLTRAGSMVFLVHDISDVPVDLSKLANFLKWKVSTATCFFLMVLVWCCTRLGVLPFTIYRSILTEGWMVCSSGVVDPIYYVHFRHFFNTLMGLLIFLHLAWFTMFIQMGYVLIRKGEAHDLSEHKKGEKVNTASSSSNSTNSSMNNPSHRNGKKRN